MSANGICSHNNLMGYCPSCFKEKTMYQQSEAMNGGMGATCQDGYYEAEIFGVKTGQCIPNLKTVTTGITKGAASTVATGVATSPATKDAVKAAASSALGDKIFGFYSEKPMLAWGLTAGVGILVIYGAMSFIRGK